MKKSGSFAGILALTLVFGMVLAGCGDGAGGSDPTHEVIYVLTSGTLTITGDGEGSVPKTGDSFTLVTTNGKEVTGTIEVASNGAITFKNKNGDEALPSAKIEGSGGIAIAEGEIIFDDGNTGAQGAETVAPLSYRLTWGYWENTNYSTINGYFSANGGSLISAGSNAGYLTGTDATSAFNIINSPPYANTLADGGMETGSFEKLIDFQHDGIGLPSTLKSNMRAQKANMPVGGVFQKDVGGGYQIVVVFYIEVN